MNTSGEAAFAPNGVITLLTDFGLSDPFVGVMKGVILGIAPHARFVDLTHGIPPQDVHAAAFWLRKTHTYFPPGSVHLVVVDPGVGGQRAALAACADGQCFVAPDNGVLDAVLSAAAHVEVVHLEIPEHASHTFHGRDVFAPAAARLTSGIALPALGTSQGSWLGSSEAPSLGADTGRVVVVDHFGNLITDLEPEPTRRLRGVRCQGIDVLWSRTYGDVPNGQPLSLRNSWGCVEIAVSGGNAANALGAGVGTPVHLLADD